MSAEKCNGAALRYVAAGLKTKGQVMDYLKRKGFADSEVEEAVRMLEDYNYINDTYYCTVYYKEACRKGRGRRRIEQELESKKISRDIIRDALDDFLSEDNPDYEDVIAETLTEKERAMRIAEKMTSEQKSLGKPIDRNFCAKVGRRLMTNGYSNDIIYHCIGQVMKGQRDE
ncbi:MAG: RecX family transcriptional regulator [Firmicutes bacterium]|nr:RecX family transcriptional regulator [Bacillota bacterium]